jgi:hypothetical protein
MGLLGFAYRVATLPLSIAYTPIRLASEVLFGSNEDVLREEIKKEKEAFEKEKLALKGQVPINASGHSKDMQTVCASVDMKKADAKIKVICNAEKSSPLSVEMRGGASFFGSRSVAQQRVTPEITEKKNRIGATLVTIFGQQDAKAIIDAAFNEPDPNKQTEKLKVIDTIVQSIMKPVPEPLPTNVTIIIAKYFDDSLDNKIIQGLSPRNIMDLKKKRAADTLSTLRNLCSDTNLATEEGCRILNPQQRQVQQPIYPRYLYGGRKSRKNKKNKNRKSNKTNKNNKTSRRNKSSKR